MAPMAQPVATATPAPAALPRRPARARSLARRVGLGFLSLVGVLLLAAGAGALWIRAQLRASLPQVAGERAVPGLAAPVAVERDALGVPVVRGANRLDVARALGFLHAQERFFQMDLLRRTGAGELAELFGPSVAAFDEHNRVHRFRALSTRIERDFDFRTRAIFAAYTEGINSGLAALGAPPFEYLALRVQPAPWRPEDCLLVMYAMFFELQDEDGRRESNLALMHDTLGPALADFLAAPGNGWEAPVVGDPFPPPAVPGPAVYDLRARSRRKLPRAAVLAGPRPSAVRNPWQPGEEAEEAAAGSNNWVVAGTHTASGRPLLANDMHLGLVVPNTWYRASLVWPAPGGRGDWRITGVTLPGVPAVVVGSNGHVAWGFTNSYGDWGDLVELEVDPRRPDYYRTPGGWRRFERVRERIRVHGGKERSFEVVSTIWGPVIDRDHRGRQRALAWVAHFPEGVNQGILDLEGATSVAEALAIAHRGGPPAQNIVVADDAGHIAWTIMGRMPRRVGFDGRLPSSWADGRHRWDGWLAPEEIPTVLDPPEGRIWTANARVVSGEMLAVVGDGGYDDGARAQQIRDDLRRLEKARPADMLAVQLDDRALFLTRWRQLLLSVLDQAALAGHPERREMRRLVDQGWTGRASIDSVAYRLVRTFRTTLSHQALGALTAPCNAADPRFRVMDLPHTEAALWALVTARPQHLLDPRFATWQEQFLAAVDDTLAELRKDGPNLAERTWGERNTLSIVHPLADAVPSLRPWLNMPAQPVPGDEDMPRVQYPYFGASERLAVSPGLEGEGYFHMPSGQSGHPLSPHYQDSLPAWVEGKPTPFLPGPPVDVLTLVPASAAKVP